jgi:hypothetical protein
MNSTKPDLSHIRDGDSCIYFLLEDSRRLRNNVLPRCKIGVTDRLDCTRKQFRMQILRASSAEDFEVFHAIKAPSREMARMFERMLHQRFSKRRCEHSKEWFDLTSEEIDWCRSLSYEDLNHLYFRS